MSYSKFLTHSVVDKGEYSHLFETIFIFVKSTKVSFKHRYYNWWYSKQSSWHSLHFFHNNWVGLEKEKPGSIKIHNKFDIWKR